MKAAGLVVVNSSSSWGGNEHWALCVARGMAERGHPVRFLWSHEAVGERVRAAGLDHRRLLMLSDFDPLATMRLARHLGQLNARAVLLTRWREYLLGGLAARLAGKPQVVLRLGLRVVPKDDFKRRLIFRLADRVIVNAPEIKDTLTGQTWIDPGKIAVIVNGLDLAVWLPGWEPRGAELRRQFRNRFGLDQQAPLAVNVGNLTGQKDQATLIEACALLRSRVPDLRVLIFGEGDLHRDLQSRINGLGLQQVVTLAGFAADPMPALAAADLFIFSSRNEGMARALIEAAAAGLPAVTTDVSGARYCVQDEVSGLVTAVGDAAALAEAAGDLLLDPVRRAAMGRQARRLAEERFPVARMLDETEAVLFGPRPAR